MPDKKTLARANRTSAKESRRAPRPANSYARKWSTYARASMAPGRPSRPSPSACRRLAALASRSRCPAKERCPRKPAAAPNTTTRWARREQKLRRRSVRAQRSPRSNAKAAARQARQRFPGKPKRPPKSVPRRIGLRRRARQRALDRAAGDRPALSLDNFGTVVPAKSLPSNALIGGRNPVATMLRTPLCSRFRGNDCQAASSPRKRGPCCVRIQWIPLARE